MCFVSMFPIPRSRHDKPNKAVQIDNLRGVFIVVSLLLLFTTMQTPHKLRLTAALNSESKKQKGLARFAVQRQIKAKITWFFFR